MTDSTRPPSAADALRLLLDDRPDPDIVALTLPSTSAEALPPPSKREQASDYVPRPREAKTIPGLPANIFVVGDAHGNTLIVEPSDLHIRLVIELRGKGNTVIVRRDCRLDAVLLAADGAYIEIGEQTEMHGARIVATESVRCVIGSRCMLAGGVRIRAADEFKIFDEKTGVRINDPLPIRIEDDVWICENVQVSKGTTIGTGSFVNPHALGHGDYPPKSIISGVPAKVIRTGINWRR